MFRIFTYFMSVNVINNSTKNATAHYCLSHIDLSFNVTLLIKAICPQGRKAYILESSRGNITHKCNAF